jgi:cardiolipin synthase A/B
MGRLIHLLRLFPVLLTPLGSAILTSCQLPASSRPADVREFRKNGEKSIRAQLSADGQHLGLRFLLKGKDAYATASLTKSTTALTFHQDAKAAATELGSKPATVPVFGPAVWRATADTLAFRLAPDNPKQGTLILAGGRELIAHRVEGKGRLTPLDQRPRSLKIVRSVNARTLAGEVFRDRCDALDRPGGTTGPVVLLTGTYPELVYLDRARRRLVFLTVPAEDAVGLPLQSQWDSGSHIARQLGSFIFRSNVVALLKNPFSTSRRFVASTTSIASAGIGRILSRLPDGPPPPVKPRAPMNLQEWQAELSGLCSAPQVGASLRIRLGGDEFFPDFVQAMQEARKEIDLQMYIFDNDDYAVSIADLLRKKSNEGLRVRVLMDEAASFSAANAPPESPMPADFTPPDNIVRYLRNDSSVQVRCMPMSALTASHTKIITVDRAIAWLGGMNIGREYRYDWHDMMVEVRGPLVPWIQHDFSMAWARHGWGGDFAVARRRLTSPARGAAENQPIPAGMIPVQPLYTSSSRQEIAKAQLAALNRSQQRVWVQNAYLSDDAYITALVNARYRGVDVRVVFPADNDNGIMAANNRAMVPLLRRHGIRVYLLPGMSHVKAALYDGWACVGSANFDRLSLRVNNEFSIGFSDPKTVRDLEQRLFETDFRRSREITGQPQPGPTDELMNALIRSLAGQL